ncbi:MAG: DUF1501 domain-containing protein [Planctomycetes bacterium]|nr:DUF1501 domain-containing protein [Planctomycetota bacterium]
MLNRTLVAVFLRGGADGLALVPADGDADYQRARPRLAQSRGTGTILDERFSLATELAALAPLWHAGQLAVVHDVASGDDTRSHFYAQPLLERGGERAAGGWIARFALARGTHGLSALAFGTAIPESLRGAASVSAVRELDDLDPGPRVTALGQRLAALYDTDPWLGAPAADTRSALERLRGLRRADYRPERGAEYGSDGFSIELAQAAQLIKLGVDLPAVCIDLHGWDSHVAQDQFLAPLMRILAGGLAAFALDLGPALERVSIVVYTEFGRRVGENSALGTDHGHGFVSFVIGGGVRGGVHGTWSGLGATSLLGPGDLPGTVDYRRVLAPVVERHGVDARRVFPDFDGEPIPL